MIKMYLESFGTSLAIGLESKDPIEIERWFFHFYNHKATSGDLMSLGSPDFFYFITTREKLAKAAISAAQLRDDKSIKGLDTQGLKKWAENYIAAKFINQCFFPKERHINNTVYDWSAPDVSPEKEEYESSLTNDRENLIYST